MTRPLRAVSGKWLSGGILCRRCSCSVMALYNDSTEWVYRGCKNKVGVHEWLRSICWEWWWCILCYHSGLLFVLMKESFLVSTERAAEAALHYRRVGWFQAFLSCGLGERRYESWYRLSFLVKGTWTLTLKPSCAQRSTTLCWVCPSPITCLPTSQTRSRRSNWAPSDT